MGKGSCLFEKSNEENHKENLREETMREREMKRTNERHELTNNTKKKHVCIHIYIFIYVYEGRKKTMNMCGNVPWKNPR